MVVWCIECAQSANDKLQYTVEYKPLYTIVYAALPLYLTTQIDSNLLELGSVAMRRDLSHRGANILPMSLPRAFQFSPKSDQIFLMTPFFFVCVVYLPYPSQTRATVLPIISDPESRVAVSSCSNERERWHGTNKNPTKSHAHKRMFLCVFRVNVCL